MKKIISLIMVVLMITSVLPMSVFAEELNQPILTIESADVSPGTSFDVNVTLKNNPGIVSANLRLVFDEGLTLVGATNGAVFSTMSYTPPKQLETVGKITLGCQFAWFTSDISDKDIKDGTIITLTFELTEEAEIGDTYNIAILGNEGDFVDKNLTPFALSAESTVTAVDYTPGDVNDDGNINMLDVVYISRYIVDGCKYDPDGYAVKVNENAANINGDSNINMVDVVWLCRYIVDGCKTDPNGYNIKPVFVGKTCSHILGATEAKAATCTEEGNIAYWQCTKCKKYYADKNANSSIAAEDVVLEAKGHTIVIDPAVAPTYESVGYTEGTHCSVCSTVIKAQEEIPKLKKTEYAVTYHIANNDSYLQGLNIENNNPSVYASEEGLTLEDLFVDGYKFKGWYTSQTGGTLVTEILKGTTGNKVLYAHWEKVEYIVTFDSPDVPVQSIKRTIDQTTTLDNLSHYGYVFVGWTNEKGEIVKRVLPGTKDITLHANWTSIRNQTIPVDELKDPVVIEDTENAQFLFIYEIGKIINVPLETIEDLPNNTVDWEREVEKTITTSSTTATRVADVVSNATTSTSAWTLSEDWNDSITEVNEKAVTRDETNTIVDTEGFSDSKKFYTANSNGGASSSSIAMGGSAGVSAKVATDQSWGLSSATTDYVEVANCQNSSNNDVLADSWEAVSGAGGAIGGATIGFATGNLPGAIIGAAAGWLVDFVGSKAADSIRESGKDDSVVTERLNTTNSAYFDEHTSSELLAAENYYWDTSSTNSRSWNTTKGYEQSSLTSQSHQVSNTISNAIYEKYGYSSRVDRGGSSSNTETVGEVLQNQKEYSSTVEYCNSESITIKESFKKPADAPSNGKYRIVTAGTVHVFAVVGYDIATRSYFNYTYNVLDKTVTPFIDYTETDFTDCENGVLPFEVPYYVHQYLNFALGTSNDKMTVDRDTGFITDYNPQNDDTNLYIPEYVSIDNQDGTYSAVRINGFTSNAFDGVKNVNQIRLSKYITEIPDNAFKDCSNLTGITCVGITKIGANAFSGCTKLRTFSIDKYITSIGENAFEGVNEIKVDAANADVAKSAISSGAKRITLSIGNMSDSFDNTQIVIGEGTEYFGLFGTKSDKSAVELKNVQIKSNATETCLNNLTFVENEDTPLVIGSSKLTLNRVNIVGAPGFVAILKADQTDIKLYGTVSLSSIGENAIICKSIKLSKENESVSGKLITDGNVLVCGQVTNSNMLTPTNGKIIYITEEQFNSYLTSSIITFDPNGGVVTDTTKTVYYGQLYGDLPVPTRDNYTFDGWYTEKDGGTKITAETAVTALVNQTLYAHWAPNKFTLTYNANNGTVSPSSKELTFGDSYGALPTPKRDYYTFTGWYTAASGGTKVSANTIPTSATNVTIYAQWKLNDEKGWVKASEMPAGAQVTQTKWTYTLREYTNSGSYPLSGWVHYETKHTSWTDWSGWITWDPTNGSRDVQDRWVYDHTEYHYYRWINSSGYMYTYKYSSGYWLEEKWFDHILPLSSGYNNIGYDGTDKGANRWCRADYEGNHSVDRTFTRDINRHEWRYRDPVYTYYYYRDVHNKEATSDPTNWDNTSNEIKWVMYRPK